MNISAGKHATALPRNFLGCDLIEAAVFVDRERKVRLPLLIVDVEIMNRLISRTDESSGELTELVGTPTHVAILEDKLLVYPKPEQRMNVYLHGVRHVLA